MVRKLGLALAAAMLMAGAAFADEIEGDWRTKDGDTAGISACGGAFCIKLKTGQYAGKSIGQMTASGGGKYKGSITKPSNGKTYTGSATLTGNSLKMTGCVLGFLCESQTWTRL